MQWGRTPSESLCPVPTASNYWHHVRNDSKDVSRDVPELGQQPVDDLHSCYLLAAAEVAKQGQGVPAQRRFTVVALLPALLFPGSLKVRRREAGSPTARAHGAAS